jgi:DNA-binding MarR family transcriptional regulator
MSNRSRNLGLLVKAVHTAELNLSALINRALVPMGISRSQLSVLARFSTQPNKSQTITSLVAGVDMNQPAVTKIVSVLIDRGWLTSEADQGDARKRSLKITPEGMGVVIKSYGLLPPAIDDACEGLSDEEVGQLQMLLESFNRS